MITQVYNEFKKYKEKIQAQNIKDHEIYVQNQI